MVCDEKCDILIIGAGLAGAATAFHLSRMGAGRVVVVEKEAEPGVHSSGKNAAMIRANVADPDVRRLTESGARSLARGTHCEYRKCGSVLVGMHGGECAVEDHFPLAAGKGLWCPDDGVVDPASLLHAFLRGQLVWYNTRVVDWKSDDAGVVVRTNMATIAARVLVNAAGPWAGVVGDLPLAARNRHLYVTPQMNEIDPSMPFVWDVVNGLYFRPESGGLMLCPCDEQ
ncbi:MAG: FAD-binding oxidoreductase, partial [Planctomycetes bacterium]|nr:FAD-binding oxidoreductase [Planctomycetota bacterium]